MYLKPTVSVQEKGFRWFHLIKSQEEASVHVRFPLKYLYLNE